MIAILLLITIQSPIRVNQPPFVPDSIKYPNYADTAWPINLLFKTKDPEGDSVAYQIDWGDDTVLVWSKFLPSGIEIEQTHTYKKLGNFTIRVRLKDQYESISDWSEPLPITVGEPIVKWQFEAIGGIYSTPALDKDDNIYFGTEEGFLYSLTPEGTLRWIFQARGAIYASPVIGKNGIFFGCTDSLLYCLDFNGQKLWEFRTNGEIYSTPAIDQKDNIIFGSDDGFVYALNERGKLIWSYKTGEACSFSPAIGPDGTIYVVADSLYALTPAGKRKWTFPAPEDGEYSTSPIVDWESNVYVGGDDGFLYSFYPNGRLRFRAAVLDEDQIRSELTLGIGDTVLLGCEDGFVYKKGRYGPLIPVYATDDEILAAPVMDEAGHIYVLSEDGYFYCLERDGRLRWKLEIAFGEKTVYITSAATIGKDGTIYVGTQDNILYAFNGTFGIPDTPWPTFQQNVRHTGRVEKYEKK
ncbi:MAG: PQQ-binding-like beta-propeller repeat protein [candidate division WOR-3 bacterium]